MARLEESPAPTRLPIADGHTNGINGHANSVSGVNGINGATVSLPKHIAVVGMACRFAGDVTSPSELWDLCAEGRDCWSPIPKERFDVKSLYHPDRERPGRQHALGGYFMNEDVALFDAAFFNLPTDVANAMDPQLRLLLETVYEATEDAGIPIESLAGTNTSVFSGCYGKDYHDLQTRDPEAMPPSFLTGNYTAMMSNRISHFYNFQGASMSIDTGCSAGIACLHQGCLTIRTGESDVSIVGASSTMLNPDLFIAMSTLGMVGTDGRCYAWDERAQGYGRGEGVAVLVIKDLDAALRDGDRVHAVIRETGLNQDGKTQSITSPSVDAQVQLIQDCYRRAGLDPSETGYVEAHMTGTQAGDLAEANALARTFGASRRIAACNSDPVLVGSVKTNIGHTEGVSGLAAIIKAAFAMKNRQVPANQNYAVGNPKIKLNDWHLRVPTSLTAWPTTKPLRVSINNFGYGGTNSHVILEGAPPQHANGKGVNGHALTSNGEHEGGDSRVFIVTAKDTNVARSMVKNLATWVRRNIENGKQVSLNDLAYTLSERRSRLDYVAAVKAKRLSELANLLDSSTLKVSQASSKIPRLGFVFNGQGAQWHAMGRELFATYPVFASAINAADEMLRSYGADWSLHEELMRDIESTRVSEIHLSQPVTVALQLCLVLLLQSWDIQPSAVVSHSSGEIAAAFSVGALSFHEALGVVYYRGELARKYQILHPQEGGMIAAGISASDAQKYTTDTTAGGRVVVACVNSPESVTLSGDANDVDEVLERLQQKGLFSRKLKVGLAYHSHHMLPMSPEYTEKLCQILPSKSSWAGDVVFGSPVTGGLVDPSDGLTPEHWARNLTNPVLFSDAFEAVAESVDAVVEVGPHSTLSGPIRQILKGRKMPYTTCLKRRVDAVDTMQELACELLRLGYPVSLSAVNAVSKAQGAQFVPDLPTYAWNHTKRYWVESRVNKDIRQKRFPPHELLGLPVSDGSPLQIEWRNFLRLSDVPWLADHQVDSQVVLPGAAYISMAVEAVRLLAEESSINVQGYQVHNVEFLSALTIPESSAVEVRLRLQPMNSASWYEFNVYAMGVSGTWVENCRGQVSIVEDQDMSMSPKSDNFFGVGEETSGIDVAKLLARIGEMSIKYGPAFQNLTRGRAAANKAAINLSISSVLSESHTYIIHPTTLDCIIQTTYNALPASTSKEYIVLPRSVSSIYIPEHVHKRAGEELQVFTELQKLQKRGFTSGVVVANAGGNALLAPLRIEKLFCQAIPRGANGGLGDLELEVLQYKSLWKPDMLHDVPKDVKDSLRITLADEEIMFEKRMLRASYYFMSDAVSKLKNEKSDSWEDHHKAMFNWMLMILARGEQGQLGPGSAMWSRATKGIKQQLFDTLKRGDVSSRQLVRIGQNLADILTGRIKPLELMVGDLLNKHYREVSKLKDRSYKQMAYIVELYFVNNPGAKVLEIGGRTGDAASVILEASTVRGSNAGTLLGGYTFTDVSPDLFDAARQNLVTWDGLVNFEVLDIEKDPIAQSDTFAADSFDLIVASSVIHKTKSLHHTLKNIRKLLKPNGKFLLVEATHERIDTQLIFGTLPTWWSGEDPDRNTTPNLSTKSWDEILRFVGFSGVDFEIDDCEQRQFQSSRVILSSAATPLVLSSILSIVHTVPAPDAWNTQLVSAIQEKTGMSAKTESWDGLVPEDKLYIFTGDMTGPLLDGLDEASFQKLQALLVRSSGVLWLSCGGLADAQSPMHAQTQGLLRTLRQEDASKRYIHLDFEQTSDGPWTSDIISHITHVLHHSMNENTALDDVDWEYAVKDGMLHTPRIIPDDGEVAAPQPEKQPFHGQGRSLMWLASESTFVDNGPIGLDLPDGMVEIEVKAFGIQHLQSATNDNDGDDIPIYEFSGIITRIGHNTGESGLRINDRVCGLARGPFKNTVCVPWTCAVQVPGDISLMDAACIPIAYATASHTMFDIAKLTQGEAVLVHQATDPLSQAVIVVAQHIGADVFATFESDSDRSILMESYNILPDHLFSVRDMSILAALMTQTKNKGVDVVFSSSSSLAFQSMQNYIARFGRFICTEELDVQVGRQWNLIPRSRCATYAQVDMMEIAKYKDHVFWEAMRTGIRICHSNRRDLPPIWPVAGFPISQMEEAMKRQGQKERAVKVVVIVEPEDLVNVIPSPQSVSLNEPNATFLVVGGLGGIGREMTSWLMEKGAQNVLVVSPNAEKHPGAASLLQRASREKRNLRLHNCDVSSEESLIKMLKHVSDSMPPIRGVIDAAMVLDDSVFESMTFDQWKRATLPKVAGTMNLDKYLPESLAFFVLLSSVTGVAGHLSQANYSAGNTFQDAFARHRAASGQPATSIDLTAVTGAGIVASDEEARKRIEALGSKSIPIQAVLDLVEKAIHRRPAAPEEAQMVVNLERWTQLAPDATVRRDKRFGTLRLGSRRAAGSSGSGAGATETQILSPSAMLAQALSQAGDKEAVERALATRLAAIFSIDVGEVDLAQPLAAYGVDSLVAVELRNWLAAAGRVKVSIFEILQAASLHDLAGLVVARSEVK
ncbi:hypothetical protein F4804DRAFT_59666 [Jackrogersella minutella]|nr:hypothetical protein F4804DRAFT_59666 [Jackrogersella minutella]